MIAERFTKSMTTDELSTYLCEAGLDNRLSKVEYEEIMVELASRGLPPEALAVLSTFGRPEWRTGQIQFK
jgi:hypothetical protein